MSWNSIMGFITSLALFLPILFIIMLRLLRYRTFMALFIYYFAVLVYNIFTQGYITANVDIVRSWGISNNLLDAPLILFTLTYFSGSSMLTKRMKGLILGGFIPFSLFAPNTNGLPCSRNNVSCAFVPFSV